MEMRNLFVARLVLHFINTTTFAARDFWPRRGASDAHTFQRSVRSEQRRLGRKAPPPGGLRRFSVLASLLLGHSPTSGDAPSSRLARTENRRNKRGRIYGTGYLIAVRHWKNSLESCGLVQRKPSHRSIGKTNGGFID